MNAILEIRGLEKRFGGVYAAKNISVVFNANEIVGIIGANGAGKTTFVNLVTGHLVPTAGTVALEDNDITGLSPRQINRFGVSRSFQIPQLFIALSVRDNLLMALGIRDSHSRSSLEELRKPDRLAKCDELARLYGIEAYSERLAGSVPQGVRKLLDIAMASIGEPKILFLDEPTSGVSMEERDGLMKNVVSNAAHGGTTLLVIEHDMDIIRQFVHRVIAFYQGEIICDAPPVEALENENVRKYILGEAVSGGGMPKHRRAHA
jgi:branched-chain amino acid transport system ATP-binding protein